MLTAFLLAAAVQVSPGQLFGPGPRLDRVLPQGRIWELRMRAFDSPEPPGYGVRMGRGDHVLRGTLRGSDGKGLAGVLVGADRVGGERTPARIMSTQLRELNAGFMVAEPDQNQFSTDDQGAFEITGLLPGRYQAYALIGDALTVLSSGPLGTAAAPAGVEVGLFTFPGVEGDVARLNDLFLRGQRPLTNRGRVRLELRTPDGELYQETSCITIFTQLPGGEERYFSGGLPPNGYFVGPIAQLELPPGSYRVAVRNSVRPIHCGTDSWCWFPRLLPTECLFEVESQMVRTARARFAPAGRIRLFLSDCHEVGASIAPASDGQLSDWPSGRLGNGTSRDSWRQWMDALEDPENSRRVRVFVQPFLGGEKRPIELILVARHYLRVEHCLAGAEFVSADLFPPGRYRLTFEWNGPAIAPCLVDVAHGLVSDVTLTLRTLQADERADDLIPERAVEK